MAKRTKRRNTRRRVSKKNKTRKRKTRRIRRGKIGGGSNKYPTSMDTTGRRTVESKDSNPREKKDSKAFQQNDPIKNKKKIKLV